MCISRVSRLHAHRYVTRSRQPVTVALCQVLAACVDPLEADMLAPAPADSQHTSAVGVEERLRFFLSDEQRHAVAEAGRGRGQWCFACLLAEIEDG